MSAPALIGVDWGTSSFRAYLIDPSGRLLARRTAAAGILQVPPGGFEARLRGEIGDWLRQYPELPVVLSGMVTSRQGWLELPYEHCPVGPEALAAALGTLRLEDGRTLHFVPGLTARRPDGLPDVMRGEETQILGALADVPTARTLLLPGTHSKWVTVESGIVQGFTTFMTGELFAVLKAHSILGRLARGEAEDEASFLRGARVGLGSEDGTGGSLARLFSARTLVLAGELEETGVASYLSGLLIGCEIREALSFAGDDTAVLVVGEPMLVARYARALELASRRYATTAPDAAARGHHRLAELAGLLSGRRG
ncbi:MAG: 2-dehydro-3-deoxygalactonokinase [Geminicoccaceae bacterium]|nr:MAG: 2-dehydro-3-deoxygalactonokinase [Geminicoccaceae bacterium]